jgi:hypothetical protein
MDVACRPKKFLRITPSRRCRNPVGTPKCMIRAETAHSSKPTVAVRRHEYGQRAAIQFIVVASFIGWLLHEKSYCGPVGGDAAVKQNVIVRPMSS